MTEEENLGILRVTVAKRAPGWKERKVSLVLKSREKERDCEREGKR